MRLWSQKCVRGCGLVVQGRQGVPTRWWYFAHIADEECMLNGDFTLIADEEYVLKEPLQGKLHEE